ncbi:hypothetical protein [Clostridium tyrobutyricum]|uniref:hypothetical protein n=1 Tax=Clostridium tyrobutyricum TaxID=1519 RepID=UPI0005804A06|nr:hypothetical protein [Clostridium tyrobutyricum]CAB1253410.1 conserved hypothetical protein [Clostridiaceae bacterium BL-3]
MDKNLKNTIRLVKKLQRKDILYMSDDMELRVEPNYQVLALIIEDVHLTMDKEHYDSIKDNREDFIYELAISSFKGEKLISEIDIKLMEHIIKEYIDFRDPFLIEDIYIFSVRMDKMQNLYNRALKQIKQGKFKNYIFH